MSLAHSSVSRRKSSGVTLTSSAPKYIGMVRNPTMPMSWKQGSQLTMTSVSTSYSAPMNIASALEWILRWVITTAFGEPVEPDVNCIRATSSSPVSTGSTGSAVSNSSTVRTVTPRSLRIGTATRNGSETTTALASIMSMTFAVSLAQCSRSVRGVG